MKDHDYVDTKNEKYKSTEDFACHTICNSNNDIAHEIYNPLLANDRSNNREENYNNSSNNTFLFELLCEELPYHAQLTIKKCWQDHIENIFKNHNILNYKFDLFITPRRACIIISNLPSEFLVKSEIIRGPEISNQQGFLSFLKKHNAKEEMCIQEEIKGKIFWKIERQEKLENIKILITKLITNLLYDTKGKKMMKWSNKDIYWFRPIHQMLIMLNDEILDFSSEISCRNHTLDHRFHSKKIVLSHANKYNSAFDFVILKQEDRERKIISELQNIYAQNNKNFILDEGNVFLVQENAANTEYPTVILGKFDKKFLSIPHEIISTVLKTHQKAFYISDNNSTNFCIVSNAIISTNNVDNIIKGNQNVVHARLEDALFFWNIDKNTPEQECIKRLQKKIYYEGLGNMYDKIERMKLIAEFLYKNDIIIDHKSNTISTNSIYIESNANHELMILNLAIKYSKLDLTLLTVQEFPELQGIIGARYFAYHHSNIDKSIKSSVEEAIYHQYNQMSDTAKNIGQVAMYLIIIDNIDKIVSFFSIGILPTSSGDPFGLRRSATILARTFKHFAIFTFKHLEKLIDYCMKVINNTDQDIKNKIQTLILERFFRILIDEMKISQLVINEIKDNSQITHFNFHNHFIRAQILNDNIDNFNLIKSLYKRLNGLIEEENIVTVSKHQNHIKTDADDLINITNSTNEWLNNIIFHNTKTIQDYLSFQDYIKAKIDCIITYANKITIFLNTEAIKTSKNSENYIIACEIHMILKEILHGEQIQ